MWTDADKDQSLVLDIVVSMQAQQTCAASVYALSRSSCKAADLCWTASLAVQEHSAVSDDAAVAFYFQDLAQQNEAVDSQLQSQTPLGEHGFRIGGSLIAACCFSRSTLQAHQGQAQVWSRRPAGHLCSLKSLELDVITFDLELSNLL